MSRRPLFVGGGLLIVGGILCWLFPLFHIRPLGQGSPDQSATPKSGPADPAVYVRDVWNGPLRTSDPGSEIKQLWNAFDADTAKARSQYGRQAGLGGAWYFCIRGQGTVETVEKNRCVLSITGSSRRACLELGVVVDNTVREAIGVKASDFANSQDFNAVSSELNRLVEEEVIKPNRPLLKPGVVVDFVGCTKVGRDSDLDPLCLIPIRLEVRSSEKADAGSSNASNGGPSP